MVEALLNLASCVLYSHALRDFGRTDNKLLFLEAVRHDKAMAGVAWLSPAMAVDCGFI